MNKNLKWSVLGLAVVGMGVTMPSCPGQQAMQQQIDTLQTSNTDLGKKAQALNAQLTSLNNDMNQVKQLLPQITQLIKAQKDQLDQVANAVKDLQTKQPAPRGSKKKK